MPASSTRLQQACALALLFLACAVADRSTGLRRVHTYTDYAESSSHRQLKAHPDSWREWESALSQDGSAMRRLLHTAAAPKPSCSAKKYEISIDKVTIWETRAKIAGDDLEIGCYGKVNGKLVSNVTNWIGQKTTGSKFKPGKDETSLVCEIWACTTDSIELGYVIISSAHGDTLAAIALYDTVIALESYTPPAAAASVSLAPLAAKILGGNAGLVFPECDGVLAADKVTVGKVAEYDVHYSGSDSPTGCGSKSDYEVKWQVSA